MKNEFKLLIDTVNKDFFICLIDNHDIAIDHIHISNLKKKSEQLTFEIHKIFDRNNINIDQIESIYFVDGPGSFMGIRASVVYAKTLALLKGIKIYTINNLLFISRGQRGKYFLDAKGGGSFLGQVKNKELVSLSLVEYVPDSLVEYSYILKNPRKIINLFKKIENPLNFISNYHKDPNARAL